MVYIDWDGNGKIDADDITFSLIMFDQDIDETNNSFAKAKKKKEDLKKNERNHSRD